MFSARTAGSPWYQRSMSACVMDASWSSRCGVKPAFVDIEIVLPGPILERAASHQAIGDPVTGELVKAEHVGIDLRAAKRRWGPLVQLDELAFLRQPPVSPQ